jgi:TRAP-type mannitol/chloroaromatic compound transport system substrate-binding protein
MLVAAMKLSSYNMYAENYHMSAVAWREMAEEFPNIEVRTFPDEVIAAMKEANEELIAEAKQESPLFAKIVESQEEYMEGARAWTRISDYDYLTDNLEPED